MKEIIAREQKLLIFDDCFFNFIEFFQRFGRGLVPKGWWQLLDAYTPKIKIRFDSQNLNHKFCIAYKPSIFGCVCFLAGFQYKTFY